MVSENNREEYRDISRALTRAYTEHKAVLVTQDDEFVCAYIPNHDSYTIEITDDGFDVVYGEFIDFENEDVYNWENCIFEVIDTDQINIVITRD